MLVLNLPRTPGQEKWSVFLPILQAESRLCFQHDLEMFCGFLQSSVPAHPAHHPADMEVPLSCCCCLIPRLCPTPCDYSMPGFPVHGLQHARLPVLHYLPEFAQIHVH